MEELGTIITKHDRIHSVSLFPILSLMLQQDTQLMLNNGPQIPLRIVERPKFFNSVKEHDDLGTVSNKEFDI
jgi:hypothetical protein